MVKTTGNSMRKAFLIVVLAYCNAMLADNFVIDPAKQYIIKNKQIHEISSIDTQRVSACIDTFTLRDTKYIVNQKLSYHINQDKITFDYNNEKYKLYDIGIVSCFSSQNKNKHFAKIEFFSEFPEVRGQTYKYLFKIKNIDNNCLFLNNTYIWVDFENKNTQVVFDEVIDKQRKQLPIRLAGELEYVSINTYNSMRYDDNYTGFKFSAYSFW